MTAPSLPLPAGATSAAPAALRAQAKSNSRVPPAHTRSLKQAVDVAGHLMTMTGERVQSCGKLITPAAARLTQFAQPPAVSADAQDGFASASLTRAGLSDGGKTVAQYSNGQRGYQANARVVTAVDELSQDTMNLKR